MTEEVRRIDVFFYGLFMDAEALRGREVHPMDIRRASVRGFSLRIGQRATLIPEANDHAWGVMMRLSHDEIDHLYADPSVSVYRAEAVLCDLDDGAREAALCFNLPAPPRPDERNPEYAQQLRNLARRLELPPAYVDRIA